MIFAYDGMAQRSKSFSRFVDIRHRTDPRNAVADENADFIASRRFIPDGLNGERQGIFSAPYAEFHAFTLALAQNLV